MAKKNSPRILVTGGAGYVGSAVLPLLLAENFSVTVVDSLRHGGESLLSFCTDPNFTFVRGDIRDKKLMKTLVEKVDIVVHLAALVGYPACDASPEEAKSINYQATKQLVGLLKKNQTIIFGSTNSNYGHVADGICRETTPLAPKSLYGKTKTRAEKYVSEASNCKHVIFRFSTAFGTSYRTRFDVLINNFVQIAVQQRALVVYQGHFARSFIHVRDMARAILHAIQNQKKMVGNVYNVGDPALNYTKKEIAERVADITGAYVHFADYDQDQEQRNFSVDYSKMQKTGFTCQHTLEEGLQELVTAVALTS